MFVWVGIDVEKQLQDMRKAVNDVFQRMDISNVTCQLPLHISLKISFEISPDSFEAVLDDITSVYENCEPFSIEVKGIEKYDNIVWIRMHSNDSIERLATQLNMMLREKYGVPLHEYDLDFIFHTTLFMDDDKEKISMAHELVGDVCLPEKLVADTFVIGTSETGENGTYRVYKTVNK